MPTKSYHSHWERHMPFMAWPAPMLSQYKTKSSIPCLKHKLHLYANAENVVASQWDTTPLLQWCIPWHNAQTLEAPNLNYKPNQQNVVHTKLNPKQYLYVE